MTPEIASLDRRFSVAPMMSYTDRHFRHFFRLVSDKALLYTEMVVSGTIKHNLNSDFLDKVLGIDPDQLPLAVQLGGDEAQELALAAKVCEDYGYQEINLNVGCPSDRVQKGEFGAVLMKSPDKVASIFSAMQNAVQIPVTIKTRIGVDEFDSDEFLTEFMQTVSEAGCRTFILHARKAWLKGLSPSQNRSVPPLNYERVYQVKKKFPNLEIILNGGVESVPSSLDHLSSVDGVMVGRAAYHNPLEFRNVDSQIFHTRTQKNLDPEFLLDQFQIYYNSEIAKGTLPSAVLKHLLGFFKGKRGSRLWRKNITEVIQAHTPLPSLGALYRDSIGRFES